MVPTTRDGYKLLHDGTLALAKAEKEGIRVDVGYLRDTHKRVSLEIEEIQKELHSDPIWNTWKKRFGHKANISSRPQLAEVVFGSLGFTPLYFTEKGNKSTEPKAFKHVPLPFVSKYFRMTKLQKVKSTYLEGILHEVCDGFLHPSFSLHTTTSYRSSSQGPNFQNQPIRDKELGPLIRKVFIPRPGRRLVEVDFSGIEVRIAYCCHLDPTMRNYLLDPDSDMHADTAADLFMIPQEFIKADENKKWAKRSVRDWAKNRFVFPEFYGSVYFQCAPHIWEAVSDQTNTLPCGKPIIQHLKDKGIRELGSCAVNQPPRHGSFEYHVKQVEKSFWEERFPVFTAWKNRSYSDYCTKGYIELKTGFRCSGLYRRNQVLNLPIQGPSFHCLLQSFIWLTNDISSRRMRSRLIGQIHDSALADVPEKELDDYLNLAHEIMTERLQKHWGWIVIPLDTESEVCDGSWANKVVWTQRGGKWRAK